MIDINLLEFQSLLKIKNGAGVKEIFDVVRKKWLRLQPEEWVRQLIIMYLSGQMNYPLNHFSIEKIVQKGLRKGRWDILILGPDMKPFMLIECKAPNVAISEKVVYQACVYNKEVKAPFICLSNGLKSCCLQVNTINNNLTFLSHFPLYPYNKN